MLYERMPPLATWVAEEVLTTLRSAPLGAGATVTPPSLAMLLAAFGSIVVVEATAALVIVVPPGAVTVTTIVTTAKPGFGMEPRLAVTFPLDPTAGPAQVP